MPDLDPASIEPRADIPRVCNDELRYLASSGAHISSEATRSLTAELLAAREQIAEARTAFSRLRGLTFPRGGGEYEHDHGILEGHDACPACWVEDIHNAMKGNADV
ncbi:MULTISPECIES: hypothetical protein [Nocardia]|uniref:hypothetical protein n=1 Tax=Nocardia TaxID=1817 RepID=UPI000D68D194|nr:MULTISPECIES: hypothetical protein [Nocardia]